MFFTLFFLSGYASVLFTLFFLTFEQRTTAAYDRVQCSFSVVMPLFFFTLFFLTFEQRTTAAYDRVHGYISVLFHAVLSHI